MGNERSAPRGLEIDEKSVEITDFWVHYTAHMNDYNTDKVSVFISEPSLHYNASFGNPSPLEKAAKNLMLYRHPCILKYISSWFKGSKFFLTTEQVKPLIQSIEAQSTLQICMGLYSILRALVFLHEKAFISHNNICGTSVYVTPEGCWKLGGLECLCKSIDAYAFGVLAEDILKLKDSEDIPGLLEFKQFCKENLQNSDPELRSKLSNLLLHPFFTHDFMRIYAFLEELPLKCNQEKEMFFGTLITQLRTFPENIVAEQLGRLLLSRIVLLDVTAQEKLLPFILKPRDRKDATDNNLFTVSTFKVHLVPKLLQMFCIRDLSIRLVLLSHFNSFVHAFQVDELKSQVLPELLVGIKDTNDHLVSATLKALAYIVPILGATTVIGGKRGKLFTDGRPHKLNEKETNNSSTDINEFMDSVNAIEKSVNLPERPSPDGGEDKKEVISSITEEEYTWSDWDLQENAASDPHLLISRFSETICQSNGVLVSHSTSEVEDSLLNTNTTEMIESKATKQKLDVLSDISELDIKNSKLSNCSKDEYDYFTDMEPVIKKTQVLHVLEPQILSKSVFDMKASNEVETTDGSNGWDEDLSDWGTEDGEEIKS
nr:PREDICTED: protein-associating with the carboxyl-terminal domain of ezrin isoform X3 [Megachile rotundata]